MGYDLGRQLTRAENRTPLIGRLLNGIVLGHVLG